MGRQRLGRIVPLWHPRCQRELEAACQGGHLFVVLATLNEVVLIHQFPLKYVQLRLELLHLQVCQVEESKQLAGIYSDTVDTS